MVNLIFFGSDRYSALVLRLLYESQNVSLVLAVTTRPKPVDREQHVVPNPVEKYAKEHDIKLVYYPDKEDDPNTFCDILRSVGPAVGLSASFPRLMPPAVITVFHGELFNIHPSLLPQYRNVAPVPYAIAMGDEESGVSIFRIGNGIDNGEVVAEQHSAIQPHDTTPLLLYSLFAFGTSLFLQYLADPTNPALTSGIPVIPSSGLIFTRKLTRAAGFIEWPVMYKLLEGQNISPEESENPLIRLRLQHFPDRNRNILRDLIRGLTGYEKVWSEADTKKRKDRAFRIARYKRERFFSSAGG